MFGPNGPENVEPERVHALEATGNWWVMPEVEDAPGIGQPMRPTTPAEAHIPPPGRSGVLARVYPR